MKKSWGLTEKILTGEKTIESRWYKFKRSPWDKIKLGEVIYFKNSGEPVTIKASVVKVVQIENLTTEKRRQILTQYGEAGLGIENMMPEMNRYVSDKKYCILIFLDNVEKIQPFEIDKGGYGAMSAWITIDDIFKIKKV